VRTATSPQRVQMFRRLASAVLSEADERHIFCCCRFLILRDILVIVAAIAAIAAIATIL
jgi:hypothetical protein